MGVRVHPADRVVVTGGPLAGHRAEVSSIDVKGRLAYVIVRPDGLAGRRLLGVVPLSQLRSDVSGRQITLKGRPRTITAETIDRMHALFTSEGLTHAEIAERLGVSRSSVTKYLRERARQAERS